MNGETREESEAGVGGKRVECATLVVERLVAWRHDDFNLLDVVVVGNGHQLVGHQHAGLADGERRVHRPTVAQIVVA